ncbi:MAG TPA: autotransporter-associated beta strand repeat-containing protein [Tepidisphaeraceae bacterium]|nr:autotransporter-associated beta strand repeat-containing protein [Tepidisphaeraceae bacterium]
MRKSKLILAAVAASALTTHFSFGQDFTWQSFAGGTYQWNGAGVWSPAGTPSVAGDTADISGPVTGGALNIALPTDFLINQLTIGNTNATFPIDIGAGNSGGGALILNSGTIIHNGGEGAVNTFSAPLHLGTPGLAAGTTNLQNSNFRVEGTNGGVFNFGNVTVIADNDASDGTAVLQRTILLTAGSLTNGATYNFGAIQLSQPGAVQRGNLVLTSPQIAATGTPSITFAHGGTVNFNGVISNGGFNNGQVLLGMPGGNQNSHAPIPTTYVFNVDNTYSGNTQLNRGIFLIKTDQPFGTGVLQQNAAANAYGTRFMTDNDSRTITNNWQIQHTLVMTGEHSITMSGNAFQSNNRELVNLLPDNKAWTVNGFIAVSTGTDGGTEANRALTFDGSGNTVVNGPIYNHRNPWFPGSTGDLAMDRALDPSFGSYGGIAKRGTGVLTLNSSVLPTITDGTTSFTGPTSTLLGPTSVAGGLLQFANPAAYGKFDTPFTGGSITINSNAGTSRINVIAGGAIGVLSGTLTTDFFDKLNASTMSVANDGGLALAGPDAAVNLDLTTAGPGVTNMSVGAVAAGVSYTGTITPNASLGYRLGGGGTLTLPNTNALTGSRNVTVTNGGTVAVTGNNNYTGVTTIRGDYIHTHDSFARDNASTNSIVARPYNARVNSTLVASVLGNGGTPSSIGSSSSAASNLVLSGGTLKYVGSGATSDRLFSIDTTGATLDSSGAGALNLNNTGAAAVLDVGPLTVATLTTGGTARLLNGISDISRLTVGMTVTADVAGVATFLPAGSTIQGIAPNFGFTGGSPFIRTNNLQAVVSLGSVAAATNATLTFGNQNRNLNLTGTNAGANTLAAQLVDSAAGKLGLAKSGTGAWSVTGANNTFSGGVTVDAGTLTVKKLLNNGTTTINGGTLRIGPGGSVGDPTSTSKFVEDGFSIAGGATPAGRLDVAKNGVIFDYDVNSPEASIRALIIAGRAGGSWTGNGITSSDAAALSGTHGVGYAEASSVGSPSPFLGVASDSTAVLVRYTRLGDANLSGGVSLDDFTSLAAAFGAPGGNWSKGDFNYDGNVNLDDFTLLAANFGQNASGDLPRGSAVPEPATLSLLATAGLMLARRRK